LSLFFLITDFFLFGFLSLNFLLISSFISFNPKFAYGSAKEITESNGTDMSAFMSL